MNVYPICHFLDLLLESNQAKYLTRHFSVLQKYEIAAAKEFVQYVRKMAEQKDNHPELFDRSLAKPGKASGKRRGPGMTGYALSRSI
jgi:hypothetical protein